MRESGKKGENERKEEKREEKDGKREGNHIKEFSIVERDKDHIG